MKRSILLLALLFIFILSYGQKIKQLSNFAPYSSEQKKMVFPTEPNLKSEGEVFFTETFNFKDASNPRGWTLPAGWQVVEEGNFGQYWVWRAGTDSIRGKFTFLPGHIYSKTPQDGYWVLPMDEYNYVDGISTGNYGMNWFQLPELDCSNHPTVIFKMSQYFRCCCGAPDAKMLVSNDFGVHWASFNMVYETGTNIFCKNPYPEANITEVAGGMAHVWIKFVWNTNSNYFWCIDDLSLSEAFNNEMQLEQSWLYMTDLEANGDEGFVYMVPAAQTGTDAFGGYTFKGGFLNAGRDDQEACQLNVEVFKNGASVYNQNSTKVADIWALQRDTFDITTPFVPDGFGDYQMVLTAQQKATDGRPANNVYQDTYFVTDSVYSVSDWDWETYSSTAGWVGGNNDGDYLGILYDIKNATEVNSISTMIMQRHDNPKASTQVGYGFQNWLFKLDAESGLWVEAISGAFTEVTQEMLNHWVTVPLDKDGESEFIQPGQYIAAIQTYHNGGLGADNSIYRFTIGSDRSHRYSDGKTKIRFVTGDTWGGNSDLSMIRLNLNNTGAPKNADVIFNVDMTLPIANGYFNPSAGDFVDVAGTFNTWDGSAFHLTDADGNGIYTLTVPALATFLNIEYKYRINGNWNTSEFPSGGPNRVYRTSFYNMINDIYNNGASLSVDLNSLTSSINVYPNPTDGEFTLSVTNAQVADLNIVVANIQGQTVYQNQVKSVLNYQENIDLTQFAKGMYFLKVNNQVMKLLVK
ncbi:MAG: T9SS C-terminal target domain-containing protein [Porphyromonadaceae bacterium]|nr:MAG: T9SS C-terminal target domain-containing protein [Porphyromonadaceae bacterium]